MDDSELRRWLQQTFKVSPNNLHVYRQALMPRQFEVLEFLGDSVLGLVVAEHLTECYRFLDEPGWFTKVKAEIVCNETLEQIAADLQLARAVQLVPNGDRHPLSGRVLGDMLEALIGAIYRDRGFKACQKAIEQVFKLERRALQAADPEMPATTPLQQGRRQLEERRKATTRAALDNKNPIAALQEFLASKGEALPDYTEVNRSGPPHQPTFLCEAACRFQGRTYASEGKGSNLKSAKQSAARSLLKSLVQVYQQRWQSS